MNRQAETDAWSEVTTIDLAMSTESDGDDTTVTSNSPPPESDDSDDEIDTVGWSDSPIKLELSKRRPFRSVSDPNGAKSTAVSAANNETLERFRAALRRSICLEYICQMTST
jgi:hypothetical protein